MDIVDLVTELLDIKFNLNLLLFHNFAYNLDGAHETYKII